MPRALLLLLLLCFLATACDGTRLQPTDGSVRVSPAALALPDAFVGFPTQAAVTVSNRAPATRTLSVKVTGPFATDAERLTVPAATEVELQVRFLAEGEGDAEGALTLSGEAESLVVALSARARVPPACGPAGPCVTSSFDGAAGRCVERALPDGAACLSGAACFLTSQCLQGACVGTPRSCDDGDLCTVDACDPETGCLPPDATPSCPAPADPCHAATCDPATGCGVVEVADGTPCGDADCATAHVCMRGACQLVQVPDGAACGGGSPCQAAGVCRAQACVQPAAVPLVPAWTYQPPNGASLAFLGLADLAGNLYWAECTVMGGIGNVICALVSASPDGAVRYRAPLGGQPPTSAPLIADGLVVVGWGSQLEARRTSDGAVQWSLDLRSIPPANLPLVPPASVEARTVADDGRGGLVALVRLRWAVLPDEPTDLDVLLGLATATGSLRWTHAFAAEERPSGLIADEAGRAWVTAMVPVDGGVASALLGFSPGGVEVARASGAASPWLSGADGRIAAAGVNGALQFFSTADAGTALTPTANWWVVSDEPVLGPTGAWVVASVTCCPTCPSPCPLMQPGLALSAYGLPGEQPLWSLGLSSTVPGDPPYVVSSLALTSKGDLLFARSRNQYMGVPEAPTLRAVSASGGDRFSCELPATGVGGSARLYTGTTLLSQGRWFVAAQDECFVCDQSDQAPSLMAFDVPGSTLAPHGWPTARGNPQRSGRPR